MNQVYKYLPAERASYLHDELLRFTQPGDLNDPFECLPDAIIDPKIFIEMMAGRRVAELNARSAGLKKWEKNKLAKQEKKAFKQTERHYSKNPDLLPEGFLKTCLRRMNERIGILSLTETWNNSLMWSHYANGHEGFCVGFDRSNSFFQKQKTDRGGVGKLVNVIYSKMRVPLDLTSESKDIPDFLRHKNVDWKYEEEVRLIRELSNCTKEIKAEGEGGDELPHCLFIVPHGSVIEVIAGVNASGELVNELREFTERLKIPFYKARISTRKYDLGRDAI